MLNFKKLNNSFFIQDKNYNSLNCINIVIYIDKMRNFGYEIVQNIKSS